MKDKLRLCVLFGVRKDAQHASFICLCLFGVRTDVEVSAKLRFTSPNDRKIHYINFNACRHSKIIPQTTT